MAVDHYLSINNSKGGNIFVIGDVHGAIDTLKVVLDKLTPNDTLVIVGDLIDRGAFLDTGVSSSSDVLDLIIKNNELASRNEKPYIHSIKGNHELDFLWCIDLIRKLKQLPKEELPGHPMLADLLIFVGNGGGWIFNNQMHRKSFEIYCDLDKKTRRAHEQKIKSCLEALLIESVNDEHTLINQIEEYEKLIRSLPYIIKIEDELHPAWVAHADLPFTDVELNAKIRVQEQLSLQEMMHLTNARKAVFSQIRTEKDDLVYCGHNPIGLDGGVAVRDATNHINLDSFTYWSSMTLLVNHTQGTVEVVSVPGASLNSEQQKHRVLLDSSKQAIERYFQVKRSTCDQVSPSSSSSLSANAPITAPVTTFFYQEQKNTIKRKVAAELDENQSVKESKQELR